MVTPESGAVAFDGTDITHLPMYKRARLGIGYLPQEQSDFRRLTVWQNLMAILETLNISRSERNRRADQLFDQYGLTKCKKQLAYTLSGGERRKLEIARTLWSPSPSSFCSTSRSAASTRSRSKTCRSKSGGSATSSTRAC